MCDADRSVEREARKRENDILAIVGSGVQILEMIVESKRDKVKRLGWILSFRACRLQPVACKNSMACTMYSKACTRCSKSQSIVLLCQRVERA